MVWSALQFNQAWDTLYGSCEQDTQETADRRLDFLQEHGNQSRAPISKHLVDGIFELRAKDARFLYYFGDLQTIIFVHGLVKKRGDVPPADIKIAKDRRTYIKALKVDLDAIPR
jgi:phage-related protein